MFEDPEGSADRLEQFIDYEMIYGFVPLSRIFGAASAEVEECLRNGGGKELRLLDPREGAAWIQGKRRVKCLRCGLCCFRYEVDGLPGYAAPKPICQNCCHNLRSALVDGAWQMSACGIHTRRPAVCAEYDGPISAIVRETRSPDGSVLQEVPCAEGLAYWVKLTRMYGGSLPEEIAGFFPACALARARRISNPQMSL